MVVVNQEFYSLHFLHDRNSKTKGSNLWLFQIHYLYSLFAQLMSLQSLYKV